MSRHKKQLAKLNEPGSDNNWTLDELISLLLEEGWVQRGGKGSHRVFTSPDYEESIVLAAHGKGIKPVYIRTVRIILNKKAE